MKKKLFITNCIMLFLIIIVYKASEYILNLNNLGFLNITKFIITSIFTILLILLLIQIISFVYYFTNKNIIVTTCLSLILSIGMIIYLWLGVISYAFSEKEHFVEKDSKKMVACVNSFMTVRVEYYDYINSFVRGSKIKIEEDYGEGGYDPFDSKEQILPKKSIYYNDDGDVVYEKTIKNKIN